MDLVDRISRRHGEFLLFAMTPPRSSTTPERAGEVAESMLARLAGLDVAGLVLYDITDESERNPDERPFPFQSTMDPADFLAQHLGGWQKPAIVYRAVGEYAEADLVDWIGSQDPARRLTVFVGAPTREQAVATTLPRAQEIRAEHAPQLQLGGVCIPERHVRTGHEHLRMLDKQAAGCTFFVSQVIYDVNAAKDMVSDYHYECADRKQDPVPIVFTFSVCGSMKTLEFLQWLGVDVPRWIQNELRHAGDTLEASFDQALATARELIAFCRQLGMPFGINVESVSIRRAEIDRAVDLAAALAQELA